jgi:hypothetical protein
MRRIDTGSVIGLLLFILVVAAATLAVVMYKNYNVSQALIYTVIGIGILFIIGLLFTGIKLPSPRTPTHAKYWRTSYSLWD